MDKVWFIFKSVVRLVLCFLFWLVMLYGRLNLWLIVAVSCVSFLITGMHRHSHKSFDIDFAAYKSELRAVNVIFKLLFCISVLVICIAGNSNLLSLYVIVTMGIITIVFGGTDLRQYISAMLIPIYFIAISSIAFAFQIDNGLKLSSEGQLEGLRVALRSMGSISALYMLMFSTPVAELCEGLRCLRVPELIIELMFLMYRFIFVIYDTVQDMITSARARGSYNKRAFSMICSNLMLVAVKKANASYDAMLARGYDGRIDFYTRRSKVKLWQIVGAGIYISVMGVIICLA